MQAIEKIERQDTKRMKIVQDGGKGKVEKGVSFYKATRKYKVAWSVAKGDGNSKQITLAQLGRL